jgi:hypothetical protein
VTFALTTGCRSPSYTSDVVGYEGEPPVWVFISHVRLFDQPSTGFAAQIALPPCSGYSSKRIEVYVGGQVVSPGTVRLPEKGTVLQAVSCAGGFSGMAHTRKIFINKRDGQKLRLVLKSQRSTSTGRQLAWYGDGTTDYVLEDGDVVQIPMTQ